mmetsp:Transcript_157378/g.504865  ORF Transcript_157378/g.504865 Transcript_157378/m.504865 type:complete len:276 (+) Transcript_157378:686-1513(+)
MNSETKAPSSSALCANIGPVTMSPTAKMLGTFVRKLWSTLIFLPSISMPKASMPRLSLNSRRPTQTKTTSASKLSSPPPAAATVLTFKPEPVLSTPVTLVFILKFMPCFFKSAMKFFATSASMPKPPMESMNSTTVTWEPSRAHTEPNSKPMTPPPMTVIFSGTFSNFRAPVLDTIVFSSNSMPGKLMTSEPVARMKFLASIFSSPPSNKETERLLGPVKVPCPFTYVTLFILKSISIPFVSWSTDFSLFFIITSKSMDTLVKLMPRAFKSCCAW